MSFWEIDHVLRFSLIETFYLISFSFFLMDLGCPYILLCFEHNVVLPDPFLTSNSMFELQTAPEMGNRNLQFLRITV